MVPPPPPSASYLLDIDTDSDHGDSSSAEDEGALSPVSPPRLVERQESSSPSSPSPTYEQTTDISSSPNPKNKKRKKRKKKRKKKKAASCASSLEIQPSESKRELSPSERRVHFGSVSVREHERCLGEDVVPLDGGWPLGISHTIVQEYQVASTVDEFEARRQEELRKRWINVMGRHHVQQVEKEDHDRPRQHPAPSSETSVLLQPPKGDLETRQYDYTARIHPITNSKKNPLFGPLNEDHRMRVLVRNDTSDDNGDVNDGHDHDHDSLLENKMHKSPSSPNRKQRHHHRTTRPRSNSLHTSSQEQSHSSKRNNTNARRTRSNSEQFYSQHYPSQDVLHVRNELEHIRVNRTMEGSTGCTCRKLDVYLPPPDGGGKKAQHRRMNVQKVKEELRKRGKLPTHQCSRAELEQLLHDVVEQEPCCWGDDNCSCRRNGIGCQADACSCWFESHQRKGHNNHGRRNSTGRALDKEEDGSVTDAPTVECIRTRCGNNMYAVDLDAIHDFRIQFCQVIDSDEHHSNET